MLIFLTLLVPLVGGAVLPLFHFRTVKSRGIYVEAVVIATSLMVLTLLLIVNFREMHQTKQAEKRNKALQKDGVKGGAK